MIDVKEKTKKEIASFRCEFDFRIATIGTTARESLPFAILPRRKAFGFEAINFLAIDPHDAKKCLKELDGSVKYILVDIESKKEIDLMQIAKACVKQSTLVSYKPNDTTLEAADMFLRHYFHDDLKEKKILIYGAGNLGSKLALRLAERGTHVFLDSRNKKKTEEIIHALNFLNQKHSVGSIMAIQQYETLDHEMDVLIAFTSASNVISSSFLPYIKKNGLALDGGINNFTSDFIKRASERNIHCYRLDVRAAFPHSILFLMKYIRDFYRNIQGETTFNQVKVVAGGIIGNEGDIVVDRIKDPNQIVGIANGLGGLKPESEYTESEWTNLNELRQMINSSEEK